ncbi:MAG TPA: ATP-binding protein [Kofleriaceae bacterium]|nr:ATP-binding protein [Kofleriaceae bacterium]
MSGPDRDRPEDRPAMPAASSSSPSPSLPPSPSPSADEPGRDPDPGRRLMEQIAGGVARDFNDLLTVILGNLSVVASEGVRSEAAREALDDVRHAAERAAALTRQLLAFSRQQLLAPRVVDLDEVLAGLDKVLRRVVGEQIDVTRARGPALAAVRVDRDQLEQVVVDLAVQARAAMPGGGRLTLETANVELAGADAGRAGCAPGRYVRLRITDSGAGLDGATRARMFEPFFTRTTPGDGSGLGLAAALGIVQQSGGQLTVDSEPGRGTTFDVLLPAVEPPAAAAAVAPTGDEPPA